MLINRLENHVLGKGKNKVELSATQLRAIEILLRKSLPDLSSIEHAGPEGSALNFVLMVPPKRAD